MAGVADVRIRARKPIAFDRHDRISETGRFVIVTGKRIGGGGIITRGGVPGREASRWTYGEPYLDGQPGHP